MVKVSLASLEKGFYAAVVRAISDLGGSYINRGDCVLIKPNLVEPATPDSGQITNPMVIEAVARYCLDSGAARVIIGEGPSYYQAESSLRECFLHTGVSEVAERLGIEWILFDEYGYRSFKGIPGTPDRFRVTEFAFKCDKFINVPVLKTHYLTRVTLAMKNLKGCLKREDKPLFHRHDLARSVVHLGEIIRPTLNIIDCSPKIVRRQMGTGCVSDRHPSGSGLLIATPDIVAADTVGCTLMGINPAEVPTVTLGAAAGLGESNLSRMDILGEEIKQLKFTIQMPREELRQKFPLLEIRGAEKACSGCLIPLLSSLSLLAERGIELEKPLVVCLGAEPDITGRKARLLIGDCARTKGQDEPHWVEGCPPSKDEIMSALIEQSIREAARRKA